MRRTDREITDLREIEAIIARTRYLHLGMFDGDYPYVVPLHYGYELKDGRLTFFAHCAQEGHKLDCLRANDRVFVELDRGEEVVAGDVPCEYGALFESVMGRGKATLLTDDSEKAAALACLMKTQTGQDHEISEKMTSMVTVIRIDVESFTAKARRQ